ncbi:MAG: hypothetical protein SVX38_03310, partial [Chloroflexota bacterium]|nr:hypothetical protein [Chloroflexota bacterium]
MRERNELTERDRKLLEKIEEIVANGGSEQRETDSLWGFCAHLASTVPQADDAFRQRLKARLVARMQQQQEVRTGEARLSSWLQHLTSNTGWFNKIFAGEFTMKKGFALAAIVALVLALLLPALFGGDHDLLPLPRLVYAADADPQSVPPSLLAGADLTLTTDLPDAPVELRVYRACPISVPATPEEALALARDFGLPDPRVYRDPRDPREPEAIFVLGSHGQLLGFYQFPGARGIEYFDQFPGAHSINYSGEDTAALDGPPLSLEQATEVAAAFLLEHEILPAAYPIYDAYRIHDLTDPLVEPDRMVQLNPELDGLLMFGGFFVWAIVNPTGEVTRIALHEPMAFEPGQVYPIKSAEQAYAELTSGQLTRGPFRLEIGGVHRIPALRSPSRVYRPPPPDWSAGQPITVTGWLGMQLVSEDGGDFRAQLTTRDGISYDLTGPRMAELITVDNDDVEIQGTVVAQLGPRRWQLEVTDWKIVPQRDFEQLTGVLTVEGSDTWLVTGEGGRYRLPNPPEELNSGERIQVCADEPLVVGGDLAWWVVLHSPPPSETKGQADTSSDVDPSSLTGKQFVVENVELVYYVPQSPSVEPIVQPVWIFEGHNAAGTVHFVAYVQAVTEEYVQDVTVTPEQTPAVPVG